MKKVNALVGTMFLVWLLFSPVIAAFTYSMVEEYIHLPLLHLVFVYLIVGFVGYAVISVFKLKVFEQRDEDILLDSGGVNPKDYKFNYFKFIIILITIPGIKYVIQFGGNFPILSGFLGLVMFITICLANYYPPFRKKVNYWISGEENNELKARAKAEETLYAMNGMFVAFSFFLIFAAGIYLGFIN